MKCPNCQSSKIRKNGHRRGKQNYHCKECDRQFINQYTARGYSTQVKENCLKMYVNGLGFRAQGERPTLFERPTAFGRREPPGSVVFDDFAASLRAKELQGLIIIPLFDGLEKAHLVYLMPQK